MPSLYNIIRDLWALPLGGYYIAPPSPASSHTLSAGSASPPRTPYFTPRTSTTPANFTPRGTPSPPHTPRRSPIDPDDYLDALRPRSILRRTRRLPDTPTKSHWPPARYIAKKRRGKKAFRCPECRCRIVLTPKGYPSKRFGGLLTPSRT